MMDMMGMFGQLNLRPPQVKDETWEIENGRKKAMERKAKRKRERLARRRNRRL